MIKKKVESKKKLESAQNRIPKIIQILNKTYPDAKVELNFKDNFQLLVAVILSAQCTDKRVNKVTPVLFKRFPKVQNFAKCDVGELERLIYSTGFYKNKAKNIKAASQKIVAAFGGKVPGKMEDLLKLPGVARKTANVILDAGFGRSEGIVVDTHVARVSGMLALVDMKLSKAKSAVRIEQKLMELTPRREWGKFAHLLVWHGRRICIARKPKCEICPLKGLCPNARI